MSTRPSILIILGKLFKHLHGDSTITGQRIRDLNIKCSHDGDVSIFIKRRERRSKYDFEDRFHDPWSHLLRTCMEFEPIPQSLDGIIEDNPEGWNKFAHLLVRMKGDEVPQFSSEEEVKNEYMDVYRGFYGAVDDMLLSHETGLKSLLELDFDKTHIGCGYIEGYHLSPEERETLPADFYAFPDEEKKDAFYCGVANWISRGASWWEWAVNLANHEGYPVDINKKKLKDAFWSERDVRSAFPNGYGLLRKILEEMREKKELREMQEKERLEKFRQKIYEEMRREKELREMQERELHEKI